MMLCRVLLLLLVVNLDPTAIVVTALDEFAIAVHFNKGVPDAGMSCNDADQLYIQEVIFRAAQTLEKRVLRGTSSNGLVQGYNEHERSLGRSVGCTGCGLFCKFAKPTCARIQGAGRRQLQDSTSEDSISSTKDTPLLVTEKDVVDSTNLESIMPGTEASSTSSGSNHDGSPAISAMRNSGDSTKDSDLDAAVNQELAMTNQVQSSGSETTLKRDEHPLVDQTGHEESATVDSTATINGNENQVIQVSPSAAPILAASIPIPRTDESTSDGKVIQSTPTAAAPFHIESVDGTKQNDAKDETVTLATLEFTDSTHDIGSLYCHQRTVEYIDQQLNDVLKGISDDSCRRFVAAPRRYTCEAVVECGIDHFNMWYEDTSGDVAVQLTPEPLANGAQFCSENRFSVQAVTNFYIGKVQFTLTGPDGYYRDMVEYDEPYYLTKSTEHEIHELLQLTTPGLYTLSAWPENKKYKKHTVTFTVLDCP